MGKRSMEFSEGNLRAIFVALRPVGPSWPYDRGSAADIEAHLKDASALLERSPRLSVFTHRDHYGSGYASYVHLFCFKQKGKSASQNQGHTEIDGIDVYLCRLAPVAALGAGSQTRFVGGGMAYTTLSVEQVNQSPPGEWAWEINEIRTKLDRRGFVLPSQAELSQKLPFALKAKRYRPSYSPTCVFDAIFFWDE
jgi:hypothetical protein